MDLPDAASGPTSNDFEYDLPNIVDLRGSVDLGG